MAHGILYAMKATTVPIDKAGRVVLPKWVREEANLLPGDELKVSLDGQRIQLEPAVQDAGLVCACPVKVNRHLVYQHIDLGLFVKGVTTRGKFVHRAMVKVEC